MCVRFGFSRCRQDSTANTSERSEGAITPVDEPISRLPSGGSSKNFFIGLPATLLPTFPLLDHTATPKRSSANVHLDRSNNHTPYSRLPLLLDQFYHSPRTKIDKQFLESFPQAKRTSNYPILAHAAQPKRTLRKVHLDFSKRQDQTPELESSKSANRSRVASNRIAE
ncbi:hypothetical protein KM043_005177 [Ampulex compressa]|nr:hypothetical protein KM043_005177 [Ampulex compressa]